jgi:hypothetical protein
LFKSIFSRENDDYSSSDVTTAQKGGPSSNYPKTFQMVTLSEVNVLNPINHPPNHHKSSEMGKTHPHKVG